MARNRVFQSRLLLVSAGLLLGYIARFVLGAPAEETENQRTLKPIPENLATPQDEPPIDLPLDIDKRKKKNSTQTNEQGGLIAPFKLSPVATSSIPQAPLYEQLNEFVHDSTASFEAHGEQLCASGCAANSTASRHNQRIDSWMFGAIHMTRRTPFPRFTTIFEVWVWPAPPAINRLAGTTAASPTG